jgi:hypothetical protein
MRAGRSAVDISHVVTQKTTSFLTELVFGFEVATDSIGAERGFILHLDEALSF